MITNFKIFEIFSKSYEPGDYILIKLITVSSTHIFKYAKILTILSQFTYEIIDDKNIISYVNCDSIRRRLTPEEIKEFELKKDAEKYNL